MRDTDGAPFVRCTRRDRTQREIVMRILALVIVIVVAAVVSGCRKEATVPPDVPDSTATTVVVAE